MRVETCQIGRALRLGPDTRLLVHDRQKTRVVLGAVAPVGSELILGGAPVSPIAGTLGIWTYLFSLQALRRFVLGSFEVQVWLPGELVPHAADCEDWLHIGVTPAGPLPPVRNTSLVPLPAPVTPVRPLLQVEDDGGRFLFGST